MKNTREWIVKAVLSLALILLIVMIHVLNPAFFPQLRHVLLSGNIHEIAMYIRSYGDWAMFFSFWLVVIVNALGFLPAIIFSTANALIFGIVPGILISWIGETVGVAISFLVLRSILRSSAEKLIAKSRYLQKIDQLSGKEGFKIMLIARTIPYFPSGILNALGAVSRMGFIDYTVSSLLGKFPSTAIEAMIGHDTLTISQNPLRLAVIVVLTLVIYGVFWYFDRKKVSKGKDSSVP